jgi:hypothetical protein
MVEGSTSHKISPAVINVNFSWLEDETSVLNDKVVDFPINFSHSFYQHSKPHSLINDNQYNKFDRNVSMESSNN